MERTAQSENVPMPEGALNALSASIQNLINSRRPGRIQSAREEVESRGAGIDYVWTLGGNLSVGQPEDVRTESRRGSYQAGGSSQDQAGVTNTRQRTDTDQTTLGASGGQSAGSGGGGQGSANAQNQQTTADQRTQQDAMSGQRTDSQQSQAQLHQDFADYLMDAVLALNFKLELNSSSAVGAWNAIAGPAGSACPTVRGATQPTRIGQLQRNQSRISGRGNGRRRR